MYNKKNGSQQQQQSNNNINNIEKLQNNVGNSNNANCISNGNGNNANHLTKNRICRDNIRGFCRRKQCRYPHVLSSDLVVFCHDYQNTGCTRINCKFLHYSIQEEDYYKKFGEFPLLSSGSPNDGDNNESHCRNNNNGGGIIGPIINEQQTITNCCKNNLLFGSCHRDCCLTSNTNVIPSRVRQTIKDLSIWNDHNLQYRRNDRLINDCHDEEYQNMKRSSCMDSLEFDSTLQFKRFRNNTNLNENDINDHHRRIDITSLIRRLDEEQTMLRRRVETNEIKIAELRANNEYLMSQNAQLRLSNQVVQVQQQHHHHPQQQHQLRCSVTQSVTQTTTHQQTPQVMTAGVSIAPVQVQATPIVSIATPQTQIITNSGTPLAIAAANTSQAQQLAIAQQNINSLSNANQPAILGTSQITLAPAIAQGASMGLTINTSQALAMSNATQPIISYPVMTHSILPH